MNSILLLQTAVRTLKHHIVRSVLTTLGIIIGVVSIIAVMSIGEGAKQRVNQTIQKLGTNFIIVLGGSPKHLSQNRGGAGFTIKPEDLAAVKDECDDINLISPGVLYPSKAVYDGSNWQTQIGGVNEFYLEVREWKLECGSFFTSQDVKSGSKIAVIGQTVKKELFGTVDPIDKVIRIKKLPFKIIGVLEERGKSPDGRDEDDVIFAPITTVMRKLLGKNNYTALIMSAKSKERLAAATEQVRAIIRQRHRLLESDDDDFTVFTQDDIAKATDAASMVLNLLLFIIASISLIVGGIGIMNIMLVSVKERTKEIGIRMALGATTFTILSQFILEAVIICLIGGLVGVTLGVATAQIIGFLLEWPIFISKYAVVISLFSSAMIGLFFGFYPAYQAAMMNPVEALVEK
ncbi:MAG: ABC transporter permease protein [candidate division TM6 bacterium GW2011_GWF2_37_49]|nr:MAG: ABC transporter permease protein [candidate division TM6 bacterium GW2011_GWF2_37_49]